MNAFVWAMVAFLLWTTHTLWQLLSVRRELYDDFGYARHETQVQVRRHTIVLTVKIGIAVMLFILASLVGLAPTL